MSSTAETLHLNLGAAAVEEPALDYAGMVRGASCEFASLAKAEISKLVRQLFFPASGKAPKQVVFSAVDAETDVAGICLQVVETLAACVTASVAVVEANAFSRDVGQFAEEEQEHRGNPWARLGRLRGASNQLSQNLWSVPGPIFWSGPDSVGSPPWVRERLSELRLDFDYTVLFGPPAGLYSGACLLGQASDGLVLVVEANLTRRATAIKTKEMLQAANVRVLGSILSGRIFPIPEQIYKRI
jgi:hypothetical protein